MAGKRSRSERTTMVRSANKIAPQVRTFPLTSLLLAIHFSFFIFHSSYSQAPVPFRIGIDGLSHTHVHWLLNRADDGDIEIVGIAEPNRELAERYLRHYNLPTSLLFSTLEEMLPKAKPQAVASFNPIDEHIRTVRACAPRHIHVMVEKPLAASLAQAKEMERLARQYQIHLLTNYETTWYASNAVARDMIKPSDIRKMVAHHGHQGPKEIGVNKEFLDWLTDPIKNGGGAITDFGCYGANLMTWLMRGERPLTVFAVTQHFKPQFYPNVDDEATIILTYPKAQGIIQASWNWTYNRKDIEVYAGNQFIVADKMELMRRIGQEPAGQVTIKPLVSPFNDPFAYLAALVRGGIKAQPDDLSSLENNMIVMEILEAAKESVREGKVISLKK